jgi:3-oxoacyl-[acyl-carrier protein] reductase
MELGLRGKVAMVGGASRGLGRAVAAALAAEGANVAIASRDEKEIHRAAVTIARDTGSLVLPVAADLSKGDGVAAWYAAAANEFGGVDLLFANTGGPLVGTALSFDDATWQSAFELLFLSVLRTVRLVAPSMRNRGGGAILISTSSSVREPIPNLALSSVLRSGVTSLAKTLSCELAADNIRVNTLIPGRIETDRLRQVDEINAKQANMTIDEHRLHAISTVALGRDGTPYEFGRVGAFLLSKAAAYITGANVQVDGGLIKGV